MRISRIYTARSITPDTTFELEPGPSQHVARVLRKQAGDSLVLFDGGGLEYPATITDITKKQVLVSVGKAVEADNESPLAIQLGIGISRGERMDFVVQKATELGVARICPLFTERTEVKLSQERAGKKQRHWQMVAISACEQSGRNTLPDILLPQQLGTWLEQTQAARRFVLHHRAAQQEPGAQPPESIALLVGPEGGLSETEIQGAEQAGFDSLRLGPRVLRTETAPLAAIAILQSIWGDMGPGC